MSALAFLESVTIPLRCASSDFTNPFVLPGVLAGISWICTMTMVMMPIVVVRVQRRAWPRYLRRWLRPATVLAALGAAILVADGWIWLQAAHFIPWCVPPGAFSDAAKDAQFTRMEVANVLAYFGFLAGVCLTALGYIAAMQRLGLGRNGRSDPGATPATRPVGSS